MKNTILNTAILVLISTAFISCEKEAIQPEPVITEPVTIYDCDSSQVVYDSLALLTQVMVIELIQAGEIADQQAVDAAANGYSTAWIEANITAPFLELQAAYLVQEEARDALLAEMISNGCF